MAGKFRSFSFLVSVFLLSWVFSCGGGSTQGAPGASTGANLPDAPAVQSFRVEHSPITKGDQPTLVAVFTGADTATLKTEGWSATIASGQVIQGPVVTGQSQKFDLALSNKYGQSAGSSLTVDAVDAPQITDLKASSTSVAYGDVVTLVPIFTNGVGDLSGFGTVTSGETYKTGALTQDSDFRLVVTNAAGKAVDQVVTIHVSTVGVGGVTPANPVISVGRQIQFSSSVSGAVNAGILWSASGGAINADGLWTAPLQSGLVTITATSAADSGVTAFTTVKVVDLPVIQSFVPQDSTIPYGGFTILQPAFTGGVGSIDLGVGVVTSGDRIPTGSLKVGTTWTLTVINEAGDTAVDHASVSVTSGAISNITPANPTVTVGDTVTFQTKLSGVADPTINWSADGGQINTNGTWIAPTTPGEVTITATSAANQKLTTSTKVTIVDYPRAASLVAQDLAVDYGGSTLITPTFTGGTGVVDQSIGQVVSGQAFSTGSLTSATTYTLTVTNAAGKTDKTSVMVDVTNAKISGVSPANQVVTVNSSLTFHALVLNAANPAIQWSASDGTIDAGTGAWKAPSSPGVVTITATSAADRTVTSSTTVKVVDAPVILRFVSDLATVPYGGSTQLHPYFVGGQGTVDQGIGAVTSGQSLSVGPLNVGVTYKLTVTNEAGDSAIGYCTVQVSDVVVSGITPSNPVVTTGDTVQFQSNSSGAVDTSVLWYATDGTIDSTGLWIAPSTAGLYEITATSRADARQSSSTGVTVVLPPTLQSFSASQTTLPYGGSTNLLALFKDGAGTVDHGIGNVDNNIGVPVGPLFSTQTYNLTVANAAGRSVTDTVSITVSEVSLSPISPAPLAVTVGDLVQFQATVSGALDPTVLWTSTGGSITASGAWSAPMVPGKYTISAQSQADKSKVSSITLDVVGVPTISVFSLTPADLTQGSAGLLTASFTNGAGAVDNNVGPVVSDSQVSVSPLANTTYTLTVTNAAGMAVTATAAARVYPAPSISMFTISKGTITSGQTTTLHVGFSGGTGMVDNGGGAAVSGVDLTVRPAGSTLYTLTVTNPAGTQVTASVMVTVVDPPLAISLIPGKGTITSGTTTALTPTFSGGTVVIGSFGVGSNDLAVSPVSGVPIDTGALNSSRTYTMTVTNAAGDYATASCTVTVVQPPIAYSLVASKGTITNGGVTTLTPSFGGGTAVIGTTGPGSSDFSNAPSSDVGISTGPLASTKTYTLTVTNAAGDSTTTATTVTVVPPAQITSFAATPVNITSGSASMLTGVFTGGNGVVDGGAGPVVSGTGKAVSPSYTKTYTLTVTNAAGDSVTASTTVNVFDPPIINSFSPAKATITAGQSTTIRGNFTGGTGLVDQSVGSITSSNNVVVTPTSTTTYQLTVTNPAGAQVSATCTVTVVPPASIGSFTANPNKVTVGGTSTLSGVFSGGSGSVDNGVGSVTSGGASVVTPPANTTYTLTVTNPAGDSVTATTTVNVYPAPSISSFAPSKAIITAGTSTILRAYFSGGSAAVDNGVGAVSNGTDTVVAPTSTTTYKLTVTNPAGAQVTSSCTVTVVPPASISSFGSSPSNITSGNSSVLTAVFVNGTGSVDHSVGNISTGVGVPVTPGGTTTYTLTVTNAAGDSTTANTVVNVYPAPTISSFSPDKVDITSGQSATLFGYFSYGTGVVDHGVGSVSSGVGAAASPTSNTTYTLTVTNPAGSTAQASCSVNVWPGPSIQAFTANPAAITTGDASILAATFANGTGSIDNGVGAIPNGGTKNVSPTWNTTYILTVSNPAGTKATASAAVAVYSAPVITGFTASSYSITAGQSVTLSPGFLYGSGEIIGVGPVTNGVGVNVTPMVTTTYTLSVTNPAGKNVQQSLTITVIAGPGPVLTSFTLDTGVTQIDQIECQFQVFIITDTQWSYVNFVGTYDSAVLKDPSGSVQPNYIQVSADSTWTHDYCAGTDSGTPAPIYSWAVGTWTLVLTRNGQSSTYYLTVN